MSEAVLPDNGTGDRHSSIDGFFTAFADGGVEPVICHCLRSRTCLPSIAVGTAVAGGPPRRSQRAELPHWAPALGSGVEPRVGERMPQAGGW